MPQKEVVLPVGGAKPLAPYSPGIQFGNLLITSGQVGLDPEFQSMVEGGVQAQARQVMLNLGSILDAAGCSYEHILKCTVFMTDMNDYAAINDIYGEFFPNDPPARSAVAVKALPAGALVEIEAIAYLPE